MAGRQHGRLGWTLLATALWFTSTCKRFDGHRPQMDNRGGAGGMAGDPEGGLAGADSSDRGGVGAGGNPPGDAGDGGHGANGGKRSDGASGASAGHAGNAGVAGELGIANGGEAAGGRAGFGGGSGDSGTNVGTNSGAGTDATSGRSAGGEAGGGEAGGSGGFSAGGRPGVSDRGGGAGEAGANAEDGPLDAICRDDEAILPECVSNPAGYFPPMSLNSAIGVAIASTEAHGGTFHAFASKLATHMVGVSWGNQNADSFVPWACFDAIPHPRRGAATTLRNDETEVFVMTACGQLYVRRLLSLGGLYAWSNWVEFGLPSSKSLVTDVGLAVSSERTNHVYIVDRGMVFSRHRLGADPYAAFGPWKNLGFSGAHLVAAGLRGDGRQQVFVLDETGRPSSAVQASTDPESSFSAPFDFDSSEVPMLADIEAAHGTAPLDVLAVDVEGKLWTRREDTDERFAAWSPWPGPPQPEALVALAAAGLFDGDVLMLFAVGRSGATYRVKRSYDVWESWRAYQ